MTAPIEPGECRRKAQDALERLHIDAAAAWSLLGILGRLTEIERELKRRR